jgi:uncharacterized OsmC-like protein
MSEPARIAPPARLAPIDRAGLEALGARGKADPTQVRTVRCRTVTEARFRQLNFVRNLPVHVIDEPPGLLGDDTAPNPSEALLAALGSCLAVGIHANAVARGLTLRRVELELEGDINITSVWGTGDVAPKPVGFTAVRARATVEADAPRDALTDLLAHAVQWSPVAGTIRSPVPLEVVLT